MMTSGSNRRDRYSRLLLAFVSAALLLMFHMRAGATTVTSVPSSCANVTGIGTQAWSNTGNALSSDNSYATASVNDSQTTNYLQCTGYGFVIPTGATINGVTVNVERKSSDTITRDAAVRLVRAGTIETTDRSTTTDYPTSDQAEAHGGSTNLWGASWTPSDINNANFGVAFAAKKNGTTGGARTVSVDVISITIDYTYEPACVAPANVPSGLTCYCDNFNRATLNPSTIFGADWLATYSDAGPAPSITNSGLLRLTDNTTNNAKAVTVPGIFPASGNYISVEFLLYAYNGTNADGIAVTLSDYTIAPSPGAYGGSLGYAQKTGINGFAGGWIGVGIDEFGNYQNASEGRIGGPGARAQSIGVRGYGTATTGYAWLGGTAAGLSPALSSAGSITPAPGHRYQVIVDARSEPTRTSVLVNRDTAGTGTWTNLVNIPNVYTAVSGVTQPAPPANWRISFTGSTGSSTNYHEIGAVRICAQTAYPPSGGVASGFNAIDEAYGTPSTAPLVKDKYLTGNIYMKLVGTPFKLNVAALNNNQIQTGYAAGSNKTVTVKLVNQGNPTDTDYCELDSSKTNYCSASCRAKSAVTGGTQAMMFTASDKGQKQSANFTINTAYRNLAAIISDDTSPTPTVACSTDAFSVRPLSFQPVTTTANNGAITGMPFFKAGATQFSITATTNGVAGSLSGYTGTPKVNNAVLVAVAPATVAGSVAGTIFPAATSGTPSSTSIGYFTYSEVGRFTLPGYAVSDATSPRGVYDGVHATECGVSTPCSAAQKDTNKAATWTGVDSISSKNDCIDENYSNTKNTTGNYETNPSTYGKYGCMFGTTGSTSFGRFIPDHFALIDGSVLTPACSAPGFTYMNQPFNRLMFQLEAQNATNGKTQNYAGTLASGVATVVAEDSNNGTDLTSRISGVPTGTWAAGAYSVDTATAKFIRLLTGGAETTPDGPYDNLQLGVKAVDADGVAIGSANMRATTAGTCTTNTAIATDCDSRRLNDTAAATAQTTKVRFGRLRLMNAHGSEKLDLPIPVRAQYWNGTVFVTNDLDNCTTISTAAANADVKLLNQQGGVTADPSGNMPATNVLAGTAGTSTFVSGIGKLTIKKPIARPTVKGSVDVCIDLGPDTNASFACALTTSSSMPWLQGKWAGGAYIDDPKARATFGVYKNASEFIYFREMY